VFGRWGLRMRECWRRMGLGRRFKGGRRSLAEKK
jgi:hypothetical protein